MTTTTAAPGAARPAVIADGARARGLTEPTVLDWLTEMSAVVGPERMLAAWSQATVATGAHGMALPVEQLQVVGQWLVDNATDAPVRMAARSCLARLRTYQVLARTRSAR
ncbi:hypothetical protein [Kineococcus glutinatus]|uniref:Uncharacterized protein n=1 Tax=Kineococcus glutinatus TaxID=1070872 RepID=A0ABP9H787_9ACTN